MIDTLHHLRFNRWATDPNGPHRLLVPIDNADAFEAALLTLAPDERVRYASVEVTRKDTLQALSRQYGASAAVIAKLNDAAHTNDMFRMMALSQHMCSLKLFH